MPPSTMTAHSAPSLCVWLGMPQVFLSVLSLRIMDGRHVRLCLCHWRLLWRYYALCPRVRLRRQRRPQCRSVERPLLFFFFCAPSSCDLVKGIWWRKSRPSTLTFLTETCGLWCSPFLPSLLFVWSSFFLVTIDVGWSGRYWRDGFLFSLFSLCSFFLSLLLCYLIKSGGPKIKWKPGRVDGLTFCCCEWSLMFSFLALDSKTCPPDGSPLLVFVLIFFNLVSQADFPMRPREPNTWEISSIAWVHFHPAWCCVLWWCGGENEKRKV